MTITLKVSDKVKEEMLKFYNDMKRPKTPAYAEFQADSADTVVTLYSSGKAVFQGSNADIDANLWCDMEKKLNPGKKIEITNSEDKKKEKTENLFDRKLYYSSSIGSDEVGTGDYFGPIVVTAAFVSKVDINWLEEIGVKDSKKLTDEKIIQIVPEIIKKIPYSSIILSNKEYNEKYSEDINMNKIKAILHNKVLLDMKTKIKDYDYIIVDQFAKEYVYYNYLKDAKDVCRNIKFITKGESNSLAVATASLISRYIFINKFDKLGEEMDMFLLKGASPKVDEVGVRIVEKYGIDKLKDVAKLNFKNTDKIKEKLNEKLNEK